MTKGQGRTLGGWRGYSCSAQLISFEMNLKKKISRAEHEYTNIQPPPPPPPPPNQSASLAAACGVATGIPGENWH